MSTLNGRVIFGEPPTTLIIPGTHLKYETSSINLSTVPLNGGVLAKTRLISPDPYMRGKLQVPKIPGGYGFQLGQLINGFGISEVIRSEDPNVKPGDIVESRVTSWEHFAVYPAGTQTLLKHSEGVPLSAYIGVAGMPGRTGYLGLTQLGEMKKGETLFVTAASGAVGSVVVQLAKLAGLKVIASAGSDDKVAYLRDELGADIAFNYKTTSTEDILKENPFDIYFDNVNGETLDIALTAGNDGARFLICGAISNYTREGVPYGITNTMEIFRRSYKVLGVNEYDLQGPYGKQKATDELVALVQSGKLKFKEHATFGLENAAAALAELLTGENRGKAIVHVSG